MIKSALAAAQDATNAAATEASTAAAPVAAVTPAGSFTQTMLFTLVLVLLFYILLIRPQQKRYKEHASMLNQLGKGDKIVTQGGMIGTIDALPNDKEALVDFGNNIKMTVLRSSIMGKYDASKTTDKK